MEKQIKKIVVGKDSQFKIKIEDIKNFNDSFFKEIYEDSVKNVIDIIENNKEYHNSKHKKYNLNDNRLKYIDKEEKNNIIAFAGERGAGKTSAMISFANALQSEDKTYFEPMSKLIDKDFWVLNPIDPSLFEKDESIFQVIIAKLFEEFRHEAGKEIEKGNEQVKIIRLFDKVYKNFKTISSGSKWIESISLDDTLEALNNLAASSSMRENFTALVRDLLEYKFGKDKIEKSYLVLPIDDLDMNISKAADMAEQIRKYLMIPNVIILISIKVEQLTDSIEQMFRKEYQLMLKDNIQLEDNPKNMANRYIEKLIPNGRKLYLPNLKLGDNLNNVEVKLNQGVALKGIQESLLGLIYRKTGLLFVKPREGVHFLVPDNLRELQNLFAILADLSDLKPYMNKEYDSSREFIGIQYINIKDLRKNVDIFEKYFYSTWAKKNLSRDYIDTINELKLKPVKEKNKFIISKIAEFKLKYKSEINTLKKEDFKEYIDIKNNSYNISLGDVIDVLNINNEYDDEKIQKFKFAVKTCYSMEIHKRLYFKEYSITEDDYMKGIDDVYRIVGGNPLGNVFKTAIRNSQSRDELNTKGRNEWRIIKYNTIPIFIPIEDVFGINGIICDISNLIKFIYPSKNISKNDCIDDLISNIREKDLDKLYEIKCYIDKNESEFRSECKRIIRIIHSFIYPGFKSEKTYRENDNIYYDIDVNIGTSLGEHQSALFSIYAPMTRLIKSKRIDESLYSGRLSTLRRQKMYNNIYPSYITMPFNSMESLEYISEKYKYNITKAINGKDLSDRDNNYFNEVIIRAYESMNRTIQNLINEVRYINIEEYGKYIEMQFINAPIMQILLDDEESYRLRTCLEQNITLIRQYNIENSKTDAEIKESIQYIQKLIEKLNSCKFRRSQGKAPTTRNIKNKLSTLYSVIEDVKSNFNSEINIDYLVIKFEDYVNTRFNLYRTDNEVKQSINEALPKTIDESDKYRLELADAIEDTAKNIKEELFKLEKEQNYRLTNSEQVIKGI
ncbi:hypothetical protein [Paraclostridium bifermentans]|uniref:hypothetical protein n=1 Tax=Paraclostridium bifermentans TaxID=1490 RepID=UPI00374FAD54